MFKQKEVVVTHIYSVSNYTLQGIILFCAISFPPCPQIIVLTHCSVCCAI